MVRKTAYLSWLEKVEVMRLKCGVCGRLERHGSFVCDRCVSEARRLFKECLQEVKPIESV
jgi:hypothetical protein